MNLDKVPYLITGDKFPSYYDWYAIDKGNRVEIIQTFSELCFEVNRGEAQTDQEYYWLGELYYKTKGKIFNRDYTYKLVNVYYDSEYKDYFWRYGIKLVKLIIPKEVINKHESVNIVQLDNKDKQFIWDL